MPTSFRCAGATGQAPTTSFFGPVPDRLTMAMPYRPTHPTGFELPGMIAADYVNKWFIFNTINVGPGSNPNQDTVSLGGFITAPDGTTATFQKIIESASTSLHGLTSGWVTQITSGVYKLRLAVFAKADTRTRIALEFNTQVFSADGAGVGVRAVFDLAGGQIGVAPHSFNTSDADPGTQAQKRTWDTAAAKSSAAIIPFGNGVYCCQMDTPMGLQLGGAPTVMYSNFWLDSGSGTGAESITYVGNGTSGVYAWKSCLLPPGAWRLNNRVFFDHFTDPTMRNIDLTDSRAPGFDWYIHNTWPNPHGFSIMTPTPPSAFSQSGSVLTITGPGPFAMLSACNQGTDPGNIGGIIYGRALPGPNAANAYVGKTYTPPMLAAARWSYNFNIGGANQPSFWTTTLERLYNDTWEQRPVVLPTYQLYAIENDWSEMAPTGAGSAPAHALFGGQTELYRMQVLGGYPIWFSTTTYPGSAVIGYLGQLYQAQRINTNVIPVGHPADWLPFTVPSGGGFTPAICDPTQLNTYEVIWLPVTPDDLGQMVQFFNGIAVTPLNAFFPLSGHSAWGQRAKDNDNIPPGTTNFQGITAFWEGDSESSPIIWGGSVNTIMNIDWVSITTE